MAEGLGTTTPVTVTGHGTVLSDSITDEELEGIASGPIDGGDGTEVEALPITEAMRFVEYANEHNDACRESGRTEDLLTKEAVAGAIMAERLLRHWGQADARDEIAEIDRKLQARWHIPLRKRHLMGERARLEAKLANPRSWTLWSVASGDNLELSEILTWERHHAKVIDGTFFALTADGEATLGRQDGVLPMWEIMRLLEKEPLDDCDELLYETTLERLLSTKLAYDLCDCKW